MGGACPPHQLTPGRRRGPRPPASLAGVTDDEWGEIADRIASTWPTDAGDPARYRDELDHLDPGAVEAALDELLIEYRTEAPPARVLRERAEAVPPAELAPYEPSVWDDEEPQGRQQPGGPTAATPPSRRTPEAAPARESTRATVALVLGVVGLVTFPVVVSVAAIVVANTALAQIAADPGLGGERRARTGRLLGFIGLAIVAMTIAIGVVVGLTD